MDLPSHPDTDDSADAPVPTERASWPVRVLLGLVVALVALVIVLHLTGVVGPGS
jgi:hypothetical protein